MRDEERSSITNCSIIDRVSSGKGQRKGVDRSLTSTESLKDFCFFLNFSRNFQASIIENILFCNELIDYKHNNETSEDCHQSTTDYFLTLFDF